ncbi:hypothetical protein L228DRAFT_235194 [Xylona heveae TC161]|uniref:MARVEL domain-containing protein n=1 Tax=Xylona heveae (strain CBS 132557 / TC161) TaxID=1328760 RepID=A0A165JD76_XYLHT|nr:hypothetical protein L228DRAFT_235194 [Xylona heveae TC161]KZF26081.1 hypothetical protein L228DRAFT_235194 [Xylona heveae TC161]
MLRGLVFTFWRLLEIITLIPTLGMLAWFVHGFVASNQLTPDYILVLFIASVLATAWAIATLFAYHRASHSPFFVSIIDLGFVGTFIAGVYLLRGVTHVSCHSWTSGPLYFSLGPFGYYGRQSGNSWSFHINKSCAMLKACFAFGIMNCIFFFVTALIALLFHDNNRAREEVVVKRERVSRHGHRRSHSRSNYGAYPDRRSSHRSTRRQYYV